MKRTKNTLKSYFQTGDIPKQWQYENLIDSFWHLDDTLPASASLDDQVAKKNEDNQFSSLQTFNNDVNITDTNPYLNITGTDSENRSAKIGLNTPGGLWTLENSNDFRIDFNGESSFLSLGRLASGKVQLGTNNLERYEIDASGNHDFKSGTATFGGAVEANQGIEVTFPLASLDVANQSIGSVLIENNASGAEAPSIAGKTNNNSPGLQFIASTRDASGTLADMIFNIRENNNTDFTAELDTIGFQFRRYSTPLLNIYRNGKIEGLNGADFSGTLTVSDLISANGGITINQPDHNSRLRFTRSGHTDYGLSLLDGQGLTVTNLGNSVKEMQFTSTGKVNFNAEIIANEGIRMYDNDQIGLGDGNDMRIHHNGSHSYIDNYTGDLITRNLLPAGNMQFIVNDSSDNDKLLIYLSGSNQYVSLRHDGNEKLRTTSTGIEIDRTISTPTDTDLFLSPNGGGHVYLGSSGNGNTLYHYSRYNDGNYTTFSHSATHSILNSTHTEGFMFGSNVVVNADLQILGNVKTSDGSTGFSGTFIAGTHNITVKDGIITDVVVIP